MLIARTPVVCYNKVREKLFTLGRSHSGLVRGTGNAVGDKTPRGFKSHPPRQFLLMCKVGRCALRSYHVAPQHSSKVFRRRCRLATVNPTLCATASGHGILW